ncbi:hypothetical protein COL922a_013454 [Colletotrichum nupharicola]|nr:hypothetical protein COL922a_013454 [Colletotrichum nupharicola]
MKFSAAAFVALGLLAGNVLSAPTVDASDVALPIEVRAEDFVANDAAHLEARAKKKKNAKAARAKAKGAAAQGNANANAKKNNGNAATAPPANAAQFSGLACTDGKGAGSCNAQGQCAVNGKTTAIAGQCGVAAAKKNKRWVSDIAHLI